MWLVESVCTNIWNLQSLKPTETKPTFFGNHLYSSLMKIFIRVSMS